MEGRFEVIFTLDAGVLLKQLLVLAVLSDLWLDTEHCMKTHEFFPSILKNLFHLVLFQAKQTLMEKCLIPSA